MLHDCIAKALSAGVAPPVITEGADTICYYWDSVAHACQTIERVPTSWRKHMFDAWSHDATSNSWDLRAGWAKSLKYLIAGWQDGARPIVELAQSLPAKQKADGGEKYGQVGRKVSLGRYLAGDPNCMKRKVRATELGKGKAIRMAVNVAVNGFVSAEHIANYGAALVACIDELEQSGFRVELSVHSIFAIRNKKFVTGYMVKGAGDPLDYGQMAFCVGHPASERRIQFALAHQLPTAYFTEWYGGAGDLYLSDIPDLPSHALILNGWRTASQHSQTLDAAVTHCRAEIAAMLGGDYAERLGWDDFGAAA